MLSRRSTDSVVERLRRFCREDDSLLLLLVLDEVVVNVDDKDDVLVAASSFVCTVRELAKTGDVPTVRLISSSSVIKGTLLRIRSSFAMVESCENERNFFFS